MTTYKAGLIGCGGRGRAHAEGYQAADNVAIAACTNPIEATGESLAQDFAVANIYDDYRAMLDGEDLDLVSVCTLTGQHLTMVEDAARSGIKAKQLLDDGTIGDLQRLEGTCSNLFDWGTHWFDMFFFTMATCPPNGSLARSRSRPKARSSACRWRPAGCRGSAGEMASKACWLLVVPRYRAHATDSSAARASSKSADPTAHRYASCARAPSGRISKKQISPISVPPGDDTVLSVLDLVACLQSGDEPRLSGRKALQATELIFATYESSRRRGRVQLPLACDDSALLTMLEDGQIGPG